MSNHIFIHACAGAGKTKEIISNAINQSSQTEKKILITTYTINNCKNIINRLSNSEEFLKGKIIVKPWFTFLFEYFLRPFMPEEYGFKLEGLQQVDSRSARFKSKNSEEYFFTANKKVYSDKVSQLSLYLSEQCGSQPFNRLEDIFDSVLIDEFQDFAGYDFNFFELLLEREINTLMVGDVRQISYKTNHSGKNPRYSKNPYLWFQEMSARNKGELKENCISERCNNLICDFANSIISDYGLMIPKNRSADPSNEGVKLIKRSQVSKIYNDHNPQILRDDVSVDTNNYPAMNIGESKGLTFESVIIFPTNAMVKFATGEDKEYHGDKKAFYIAITRARSTVYLVINDEHKHWTGIQDSLF